MSSQIDVSVIMPAWSASAYIGFAVRSALAQTGISLELIVVDDASPDATLDAARTAADGDERLRTIRMETNSGPAAARNRALELARGRYVAVLDSDDGFAPGRLSTLVAFADSTDAALVADNMAKVSEIGADVDRGEPFLNPSALSAPRQIGLASFLSPETTTLYGRDLGYLKPVFRRSVLNKLGLRYDTELRNSEDYYLVAHLLAQGATYWLHPQCGYAYWMREGSISHRLNPELTGAILAANTAFSQTYSDRFDTEMRRAMDSRTGQLTRQHAFECLVASLKAKSPVKAFGALIRHPRYAPNSLAQLFRIARAKSVNAASSA